MNLNTFKHKPIPRFTMQQVTDEVTGKRQYVTPTGQRYPSVTTVLGKLSEAAIQNWRNKVGKEEAAKVSQKATRRGKAFHTICEQYLLNNSECVDKVMPDQLEMFSKVKPLIDNGVKVVYGSELPLWSDVLKAAGTTDLFCNFEGLNTILDFKTSLRTKKESWILSYFLQCTAYAIMIEERFPQIVVPQVAVIIGVDGEPAQKFVRKTDDYRPLVEQIFIHGDYSNAIH